MKWNEAGVPKPTLQIDKPNDSVSEERRTEIVFVILHITTTHGQGADNSKNEPNNVRPRNNGEESTEVKKAD